MNQSFLQQQKHGYSHILKLTGLFIIMTSLCAFHSELLSSVSAVVMMRTDVRGGGGGGESFEWEAKHSKMHNFFCE